MATGTEKFTANVNKTVTVEGETYELTPGEIPANLTVYLNEVELQQGVSVTLTQDMALTFAYTAPDSAVIKLTNDSTQGTVVMLNGTPVTNEGVIANPGDNDLKVTSPVAIPSVTITGTDVEKVSINGNEFNTLPQTFVPIGGIENSIAITGAGDNIHTLHLNGTNIETVDVNGEQKTLPYQTQVTSDLEITVGGRLYSLDLTGIGNVLKVNGETVETGNNTYHHIYTVSENMFIENDGTHKLIISGTDIRSISINGVGYDVSNLPVTVTNNKMAVTVDVDGNVPSEVHISGQYIDSVTLDGKAVEVGENGSVNLEIATSQENHFVNINGSQPRSFPITFNNGGTSVIRMNGEEMANGTYYITDGVYISALATPIPVNVENPTGVIMDINGVRYPGNDFTFMVQSPTEIDIRNSMCQVTIDYGDNSYTIWTPQQIVTFTAPQRDGWLFDSWSSVNCGIENPKSVRTTIDLTNKSNVNLVCHYQRYITCDKPNPWN